jgi:hypothetical protein
MVGVKCQAFFTEFNTQVFLLDTEYSNYHTTSPQIRIDKSSFQFNVF